MIYIDRVDFCYIVIFTMIMNHNPDPDDDNGIAEEGAKDKEHTSENPGDNSCDIVSILGSVGDDIVERVDQNKESSDEKTTSGRVGGGRDEEADQGYHDEQCGGEVVHQDVHLGLPGKLHLETSNRIRFTIPL